MSQVELAEAYSRAGTAFKGQMEQIFVFLSEKDWNGNGQQQQQQQHQQHHRHPWRSHAARCRNPRHEGRKRGREDEDDEGNIGGRSQCLKTHSF